MVRVQFKSDYSVTHIYRHRDHYATPRIIHYLQRDININSALTDVSTFPDLPGFYRVTRFQPFEPSTSLALSIATLGLFTASGGGGTAVVSASLLTGLSGSAKTVDLTLSGSDVLTSETLYVRNVIAHGVSATVSVLLEILSLEDR